MTGRQYLYTAVDTFCGQILKYGLCLNLHLLIIHRQHCQQSFFFLFYFLLEELYELLSELEM